MYIFVFITCHSVLFYKTTSISYGLINLVWIDRMYNKSNQIKSNMKSPHNLLEPKGIGPLGQLTMFKQYRIFPTSTTVLKRMHFLSFHGNSDYTKATTCCVAYILPILFHLYHYWEMLVTPSLFLLLSPFNSMLQKKACVMRHPHNKAALEHHSLLKHYFWCLHKPLNMSCVVYMTSPLCHFFFLHFTINIILIKHGPPHMQLILSPYVLMCLQCYWHKTLKHMKWKGKYKFTNFHMCWLYLRIR
jgi:hypothetical protein